MLPPSILRFHPQIRRRGVGGAAVALQRRATSELRLLFNRYGIVRETSSCEEAANQKLEEDGGEGGGGAL